VNIMTNVTREELAREEVELLPSRETLAFFNWANVSATNVALAQNTYTLFSAASASANQRPPRSSSCRLARPWRGSTSPTSPR
jgi:hypothetical protein